jgi:hypothetical protein
LGGEISYKMVAEKTG